MKKFLAFIFSFIFSVSALFAQMVLKIDLTVPYSNPVTLPLHGLVDVTIDWGDGTVEKNTTGYPTHYFKKPSTTITITGKLSHYGMINSYYVDNYIVGVESWDNLGLVSLSNAFYGAKRLVEVPSTLPSTVTDLSFMFAFTNFNLPISSWNTENVTNMSYMFYYDQKFNQPVDNWNTSNVTDMSSMFLGDTLFNQPIENWDVSKVTNMQYMFVSAHAFNQPLPKWNTKNVTDMRYMFSSALSFNQPIGNWNTENVTDMRYMFSSALSFNQPIGSWNISKVLSMESMFTGDTLCTINYDNLLNGWARQTIVSNIIFDGGKSKYSSDSEASRASLISKGWRIKDDGIGMNNLECTATGLQTLENVINKLDVYPNPFTDKIIISNAVPLGFINIHNSLGYKVYSFNTNLNQHTVDISMLPKGIYLLNASNKSIQIIKD